MFRDFFHALVALMKEHQTATVYNHENPEMLGMASMMGDFAMSSLVDNILPTRLTLYVDLAAALFVAVFIDDVLLARLWRWRVVGAGALLAVLATLLPIFPFPATGVTIPHFFTDGSARIIPSGSVALIAPFQQLYPADPMLWQGETGMRFRMPEGYFFGPDANGKPVYGAPPSALSLTMEAIQAGQIPLFTTELRRRVLADLAFREVGTVIVGPVANEERMLRFFGFVLGGPPEVVSDVYLWRDVAHLVETAGGP